MSEPTEYTATRDHSADWVASVYGLAGGPPRGRVLLQKLLTIGGEIGHVGKDAQNPHHKYMYASEKAIKEAVYPKFRQHGVFFSLEVQGTPFEIGNALMVPFRYRFIDVESGEEFSGLWLGTGRLGDDKGLYIAITGAIKYALTTHCGIVTGDDPEAEDDAPSYAARPLAMPGAPPTPRHDMTDDEVTTFVCANCKRPTDPGSLARPPMPSLYPNTAFDMQKGDPCYRCPHCDKYVPAR